MGLQRMSPVLRVGFEATVSPFLGDAKGDLDADSRRILDRTGSPEQAGQEAERAKHRSQSVRPGTVLGREWNGQMHRVAVLNDGFAFDGKTYSNLSRRSPLRSPAHAGTARGSSG
jgi:DUF2924 family protein